MLPDISGQVKWQKLIRNFLVERKIYGLQNTIFIMQQQVIEAEEMEPQAFKFTTSFALLFPFLSQAHCLVKLPLKVWVTAFKQKHLSPPNPKAPHAHRWALLSHNGERETRLYRVTSQHCFFPESWPFKQSGYFCTRDVWKWSRTFGDIDIKGGKSIRKLLCIPPDTEYWQQHSSTTP